MIDKLLDAARPAQVGDAVIQALKITGYFLTEYEQDVVRLAVAKECLDAQKEMAERMLKYFREQHP